MQHPRMNTENILAAPNRFRAVKVLSVHRGVTTKTTVNIVALLAQVGPCVLSLNTASEMGCNMSRSKTAYPTAPKKHMAVTSPLVKRNP